MKQLGDQELDQLLSAVIAEQKRRGREPAAALGRKPRGEMAPPALTRGQLNAVRAAFKAGITPLRIARQFGLSQSDVRKALVSETKG
jgi:DNA invertase Pin-like site-specific DNA recombinase